MGQRKTSRSAASIWSEEDMKQLLDRAQECTTVITTIKNSENAVAGQADENQQQVNRHQPRQEPSKLSQPEQKRPQQKQPVESTVKTETKIDWKRVASYFPGRSAVACASKYRQLKGTTNSMSSLPRRGKREALQALPNGIVGEQQQMRTRLSVQAAQRPRRAAAVASHKRILDAITNGGGGPAKRLRTSYGAKAVPPLSSLASISKRHKAKSKAPAGRKRARSSLRGNTLESVVGRKVSGPPRHKRAKGVRQAAKYIMRWSESDEKRFQQLHKKYNGDWAKIASEMPGRSDRSCYMHWYNANRRKRS